MHLTKKTTFEWNGEQELIGLRVDSYQPQNGGSALLVKSVSVWARNNHEIHMRVEFEMEDGSRVSGTAYDKVTEIIRDLPFSGYASCGMRYDMSMQAQSGTPVSEGMMHVLLDLLDLIEVYNFPTPRLVTEAFVGKDRLDFNPMPYGEWLKKTCMRRRAASQLETGIDETVVTF